MLLFKSSILTFEFLMVARSTSTNIEPLIGVDREFLYIINYIYIYIMVNLFFAIWEMGGSRQAKNTRTGFISDFSGRQTISENFLFLAYILYCSKKSQKNNKLPNLPNLLPINSGTPIDRCVSPSDCRTLHDRGKLMMETPDRDKNVRKPSLCGQFWNRRFLPKHCDFIEILLFY